MYTRLIAMICLCLAVSVLSACTDQEQQQQAQAEVNEPVHLTMLFSNAGLMSSTEFQSLIVEPLTKKYPNMTIEQVIRDAKRDLGEYIAAGDFPDLIYTANMKDYVDIQVALDLNPLVKKFQLDLNKFDPISVEAVKNFSSKGELFGIPFSTNFGALYYNKDIFDKFGVPYPKDGMLWEGTVELAKKVTRTDGASSYYGLHPVALSFLNASLANPTNNPATNKALFTTDTWKRVFGLYKAIFDIPGNNPKIGGRDLFLKEQTLAMLADYGARLGELERMYKEGIKLNWDVASYPNYAEAPGKAMTTADHRFMISATSKQQDAAFQAIMLYTSDEEQSLIAKSGKPSSLKDTKYQQMFGQDLESLKGKNIRSVFRNTPTLGEDQWKYSQIAWKHLNAAAKSVIDGKKDINSALREAEEATNKEIDSLNGK
jgi:multiple sugar transport system substrate-binding protein